MAGDHARLAPSSADRWVKCPLSVTLCEQFPDVGDNAAAVEGTAAHGVASGMLTDGVIPVVGMMYQQVVVTEEMLTAIDLYVSDVSAVLQTYPKDRSFGVEYKFKAPAIHADCWGTADAVLHSFAKKDLYLWDFKFGHRYVDVFENWQLLCYAAGAVEELGEQASPDTRVHLRIVQPRSFHRNGPIREWVLTVREVGEYVRTLNAAAHEALGNNPTAQVGSHCRFCSGRIGCATLQKAAIDAWEQAEGVLPLDVTPEAIGTELTLLKQAEQALTARISGLEAAVKASIQKGVSIPGWLVEHSTGREEWAVPVAEVIALGDLMGVNLAKDPEPITPVQARKAGLDTTVVSQYSRRSCDEAKLVPITTNDARRAFGSK